MNEDEMPDFMKEVVGPEEQQTVSPEIQALVDSQVRYKQSGKPSQEAFMRLIPLLNEMSSSVVIMMIASLVDATASSATAERILQETGGATFHDKELKDRLYKKSQVASKMLKNASALLAEHCLICKLD